MPVVRIEVLPGRRGEPLPNDAALLALLRESGLGGAAFAAASTVYLLEGPLSRDDAARIADEILVDPVLEHALIATRDREIETPAGLLSIEVHPRPGVTDPTAETVLGELRAEGYAISSVRTARRYYISGEVSIDDALGVLRRTVANDCIEQLVPGTAGVVPPPQPPAYDNSRREVPLLDLDDAALERLSREGHLFLSLEEMRAIQAHYRALGREPTDLELETLAQTWSEHCVHKTLKSEVVYRGPAPGAPPDGEPVELHFDNLLRDTIAAATHALIAAGRGPQCLSVFTDNAGVIGFDERFGVAFKVETHNHPSAIEPYGGAATGIGGCIRDIMGCGLGARPIASTDVFCVGPLDWPDDALPADTLPPKRILRDVVRGVSDYGNRMGIPTVAGAVVYEPRYLANPLVYCGCVGLIPRDRVRKAARPGDRIVLIGGRTGRDGIHGATFSSAELAGGHADEFAHAVQIGNPITQKRALDAILRARDDDGACLYHAITDCGAGGLSSAVGEMGREVGAVVDLERVPLKYAGLRYDEIWISEAQERMVLAVPPEKLERFMELMAAEGVEATVIGVFGDESDEATERRSDEGERAQGAGAREQGTGNREQDTPADAGPTTRAGSNPSVAPGLRARREPRDAQADRSHVPTFPRSHDPPTGGDRPPSPSRAVEGDRPPSASPPAGGGWPPKVESPRLIVRYAGQVVGDLDMHFLHEGLPRSRREARWPGPVASAAWAAATDPTPPDDWLDLWRRAVDRVDAALSAPNVRPHDWIIRLYDHEVQGGSVIKPRVGPGFGPSDAAVVRPRLDSRRGVAIGCGLAIHLADADPYWMAVAAIDEAIRNVVCVGGDPQATAILDNFCWGRCDEPESLGGLVRACLGCRDAALAFGTPFISGKDSLNNECVLSDDDLPRVLEVLRAWGRRSDEATKRRGDEGTRAQGAGGEGTGAREQGTGNREQDRHADAVPAASADSFPPVASGLLQHHLARSNDHAARGTLPSYGASKWCWIRARRAFDIPHSSFDTHQPAEGGWPPSGRSHVPTFPPSHDLVDALCQQIEQRRRLRIPDTLLISAVAIVPDVRRCTSSDLKRPGATLWVVGGLEEIGLPLDEARRTHELVASLIRTGVAASCHDVSDGGVIVTIAEMAAGGRLGVELDADACRGLDPHRRLAAGYVVESTDDARLIDAAAHANVRLRRLGRVCEGQGVRI